MVDVVVVVVGETIIARHQLRNAGGTNQNTSNVVGVQKSNQHKNVKCKSYRLPGRFVCPMQ